MTYEKIFPPSPLHALVLGGSGFIGRYIVKKLARAGYVIAVGTRFPAKHLFLKTYGEVGQITVFYADINQPETYLNILAKSQIVINACGILIQKSQQKFKDIHDMAVERLAKECTRAGVQRFVHISALGAHLKSSSRYALTKALGEEKARKHFRKVTIMRPSLVCGAEDHFFNRFAKMAQLGLPIPVIGTGTYKFQPVWVEDVAEAVLRCLNDPQTAGKTIELAGPTQYTYNGLIELITHHIHRRPMIIHIPFWLAKIIAFMVAWLPKPPLTLDQIKLLQQDNTVRTPTLGFQALGMQPHSIEQPLAIYLKRFRKI